MSTKQPSSKQRRQARTGSSGPRSERAARRRRRPSRRRPRPARTARRRPRRRAGRCCRGRAAPARPGGRSGRERRAGCPRATAPRSRACWPPSPGSSWGWCSSRCPSTRRASRSWGGRRWWRSGRSPPSTRRRRTRTPPRQSSPTPSTTGCPGGRALRQGVLADVPRPRPAGRRRCAGVPGGVEPLGEHKVVNRAMYVTLFGALLTSQLLIFFLPAVISLGSRRSRSARRRQEPRPKRHHPRMPRAVPAR